MNSMPAGASANPFIPKPSTELGYGVLLTMMETYKVGFEMKSALKQAKNSSSENEELPRSMDGSIEVSNWFFQRAEWFFQSKYPNLQLHHYQYTDEMTGEAGWSFVVVARGILVGQSIEEILVQHDYELPLPEKSSIDQLNNLKSHFGLIDEIGWKHWL